MWSIMWRDRVDFIKGGQGVVLSLLSIILETILKTVLPLPVVNSCYGSV